MVKEFVERFRFVKRLDHCDESNRRYAVSIADASCQRTRGPVMIERRVILCSIDGLPLRVFERLLVVGVQGRCQSVGVLAIIIENSLQLG